jgi:hypothetical protein
MSMIAVAVPMWVMVSELLKLDAIFADLMWEIR